MNAHSWRKSNQNNSKGITLPFSPIFLNERRQRGGRAHAVQNGHLERGRRVWTVLEGQMMNRLHWDGNVCICLMRGKNATKIITPAPVTKHETAVWFTKRAFTRVCLCVCLPCVFRELMRMSAVSSPQQTSHSCPNAAAWTEMACVGRWRGASSELIFSNGTLTWRISTGALLWDPMSGSPPPPPFSTAISLSFQLRIYGTRFVPQQCRQDLKHGSTFKINHTFEKGKNNRGERDV